MPVVETAKLHLPERYLHMVQAILQAYLPDAEAWGSRVNGDYYETSDLDWVVRQPEDLSRRQSNLGEVIDAFSESNLPIICNWSIGRVFQAIFMTKLQKTMWWCSKLNQKSGVLGYEF